MCPISGAQLFSPYASVSRFLQPALPFFTILCIKPVAIMLHCSASFLLFFGLFLAHQLPKCSAFTGPLSSSILSTCPSHRDHCSLKNSSNISTPVISGICLLFILSFKALTSFHLLIPRVATFWKSPGFFFAVLESP